LDTDRTFHSLPDDAGSSTDTKVVLRLLSDKDIASVVSLISLIMNSDEGNQAFKTLNFHCACKNYTLDDGRIYYVLVKGDAIKGVTGLHHYQWGPVENVWLAWFALDPSLHGQGLGKLLLDSVTSLAQELGYLKMFIETYSTPEFAAARAFYLSNGFVLAGSVRSYLPSGADMVVFIKELTPNV